MFRHLSPPPDRTAVAAKVTAKSEDTLSITPQARRWLALGGALIVAVLIGTAIIIAHFRERALKSAERELKNTVLLIESHFDRQFKDFLDLQIKLSTEIPTAALTSPESFTERMSREDIHTLIRGMNSGTSSFIGLNIFGADGRLLNTSAQWPAPPISTTDRDFFQKFKSGTADSPVLVSLVHSHFRDGWAIVFAREVLGENGQFLGMTTRALSPEKLEEFFASVTLGDESTIAMVLTDGRVLARYPYADQIVGMNFKGAPLQSLLQHSGSGALLVKSPIDGSERLGAIRELRDFPISVVATTTISAALADWREQTKLLVLAATLVIIVLAVTLWSIARQMIAQQRNAQNQVSLERDRLDTAVNNMTPGLLLFDAEQKLVVNNQSYIRMFGLSGETIKPGRTLREVIEHRKSVGMFDGSVDEYCSWFLTEIAKGQAMQLTTRSPDGRSIQALYQPLAKGGWVTTLEDVTERKRSEERITHLAIYDSLTDLPNRLQFRERLEAEIRRAGPTSQVAVMYIDIDEFKSINDSLGHSVGDELLRTLARRLNACMTETSFVARLGGDEFAVVQRALQDATDVEGLVRSVFEAIRSPADCLGHRLRVDASIGIAIASDPATDLDHLLSRADVAMYAAKADGRRTHRFFEPSMEQRVQARRSIELDLRRIVEEADFEAGGFEVQYQPLVGLSDGHVTGCEALLRWRHPVRGPISPVEFIPIAEDTGLICQLGEWVLKTACATAATWPDPIKIAVNVSPVQFRNGALPLNVAVALASTGLAAKRLELEITEAVLLRDDDVTLSMLHQLRALGVRIALDDFGTGYSSLSYLQRFPFDKIKIDRCFTSTVTEPDGAASIIEAVVNIASSRHMTTTAEGVETQAQRDALRALGCTEMQGYLFSAARPKQEIAALLHARGAGVADARQREALASQAI